MPGLGGIRGAPYPGAGTVRVHPDPTWLPHPPDDPSTPGQNRFDDPRGRVAVLYTATRLVGCLYETMARFRPSAAAEAAQRAVDAIEDGDVDWPADDVTAVADWLERQRVGTVRVLDIGIFVDIEQPEVLVQLDKHPLVRSAVEALDPAGRLDIGFIRLGGLQLGRPVSQAVGVAVRDWIPSALGIAYTSRLADEPCWALWASTRVEIRSVPLDPNDPLHREAVRHVARTFEISLSPITGEFESRGVNSRRANEAVSHPSIPRSPLAQARRTLPAFESYSARWDRHPDPSLTDEMDRDERFHLDAVSKQICQAVPPPEAPVVAELA